LDSGIKNTGILKILVNLRTQKQGAGQYNELTKISDNLKLLVKAVKLVKTKHTFLIS